MTLFLLPYWIFESGSRRIIHGTVPRHLPDFRLAQQLSEASPVRQEPHYLSHDLANNYGKTFACVAAAIGINPLKMPYRAHKANVICEQFMGNLRRICLDHIMILSPALLQRVVMEYTASFNRARPHQGIGQRIRESEAFPSIEITSVGRIIGRPVLAGLHHDYDRTA